ncbi:molybdopterin-dependent oxidoreductase [Microbacterium aquimaris]|uniref:Molybdopterin-dependent oxidoreductase n=1 Tax=Microbacterium aquimaris TaxID=459816 RepID=A0ABU5N4L8_9MICO|nr:molybdopterin-dependent oxidoreductase [Microbacterium aquimaris]MDZ8161029.1 molybdopterin-dependent oxidoreductase [Microbacterium aquimaris]
MNDAGTPPRIGWAAAGAGVAAATAGAGAGELTAALAAPSSSPFAVIGGALIDAAPTWAKDLMIEWFDTADKIALTVLIALVLAVVAAWAGWAELRRPPAGAVIAVAFGAVAAITALLRETGDPLPFLPGIVAGAVAGGAVHFLVGMLRPRPPRADAQAPDLPNRRAFFAWTAVAAVGGALAVAAGNAARAGSRAITTVRDALVLPSPTTTAPPVPAGAELGVEGLAPVITPNADFYRIDTALIVPTIDPVDWSLRIHGMVEEEIVLTWDELLALPLTETTVTLSCVSNEVGGSLIGNARWLGYPIRELLARARPTSDADMVLSRSSDGFTASSPLEALTDDRDAILAIGMNGEPLPPEHGFPVRMVVPGLYGYVSATKWVVDLEVTRFDQARAYWTDRGWSERGPIKLQSRIDVPRRGRQLAAGDTMIAGMAWQPHTGVEAVEVQIDDGDWQAASLATAISDDTWVQWSLPWTAEPGDHTVRCRAISNDGQTQTSDTAPPAPDGATGWHEVQVSVA